MSRVLRAMGVGVAATLLLAGCGDEAETGSSTTTTRGTSDGTPATTATAPATTAIVDADVDIGDTGLGELLVDADGLTLYVFMNDTAGASTCVDSCALAWPPLVATSTAVGEGLAASDFTLIVRPDGTQQIAVKGRPLYRFAGDIAEGDTAGQGLNDLWFVLGPDGNPIEAG